MHCLVISASVRLDPPTSNLRSFSLKPCSASLGPFPVGLCVQRRLQLHDVDAELGEQSHSGLSIRLDQAKSDVSSGNEVIPALFGDLLREDHDPAGGGGESLEHESTQPTLSRQCQ